MLSPEISLYTLVLITQNTTQNQLFLVFLWVAFHCRRGTKSSSLDDAESIIFLKSVHVQIQIFIDASELKFAALMNSFDIFNICSILCLFIHRIPGI